ncbi:MAG: divergent PAP2 family protein [Kiritimatiellia bacterium]
MSLATVIVDANPLHYFTHPWFWSSYLAWMLAQTIKLVHAAVKTRSIDFEYLVSTGGMPSAHSAMVMGLATAIGLTEGFGTPLAMLALGFAAVTVFDAATVRHAAGEQAKVLNRLVRELVRRRHVPTMAHLKELLGHTCKEVLWGMVTGICTAVVVCRLWR